jgi:transcription initiation factor TFIIIB Brf1 subunit/transcription initiation factor TFIIB
MDRMECPRCKSERIQRDYDDAVFLLRMVGMHKLLCNNCGLVFKAFDLKGAANRRAPADKDKPGRSRRRAPRFHAHLPAAISLIDSKVQVGKASYSAPSRGHCETISKFGMSLSLVGTRFPEAELSQLGRMLFVRIDLPGGPIEAVVTIVSSARTGDSARRKWQLGVKLHQISDIDEERLDAYLEKRAAGEPLVISE